MALQLEKLNWKFIVVTALSLVLISVLSGLFGGVDAGTVLVRALAILILSALLAAAINYVAVSFLDIAGVPSGDSSGDSSPGEEGSRVNIVLSDDDEALTELPPEDDEGGDDDDMSSDEEKPRKSSLGERSREVDFEMATSMDIDTLPDLGSFSSSFSSTVTNEEKKTDTDDESGYNEDTSFSSGSRLSPQGIAGTLAERNSPEDLAKAVKTVMHKETR